MEDRIIAVTSNFYQNKLISIHALEIINNCMTGIYFHAYFNKHIKSIQNDMYYYSEYEYSNGEYYLKNFNAFIGDAKVITYQGDKIGELIKKKISMLKSEFEEESLIDAAKRFGINIDNVNSKELIECTVLGIIICKKYSKKNDLTIKMTGVKPWCDNFSFKKQTNIKKKKVQALKIFNFEKNISNNEALIVIDTDTTGLDQEKDKLVAIHAVEIIKGKLTGRFFHAFINRRNHNYDYMYYLASYNYCLKTENKINTFLEFVNGKKIVSHNIEFDIGFINKTLFELGFQKIKEEKCFCTMKVLGRLLPWYDYGYKLKDCAIFYDIKIKEEDFHKGIIDAVVLGRIVCKMVENNDPNFNVEKYGKKKKNIIESKSEENLIESKSEENLIESKSEENLIESKSEENLIESKKKKNTIESKNEENMIKNKKSKNERNIIKDRRNKNDPLKNFNEFYISKYGERYHLKENCGSMKYYSKVDRHTLFTKYNYELCRNCARYFNIDRFNL